MRNYVVNQSNPLVRDIKSGENKTGVLLEITAKKYVVNQSNPLVRDIKSGENKTGVLLEIKETLWRNEDARKRNVIE